MNESQPSLLRRIYRRLYWLPNDVRALASARMPQHLIYFGGEGFGDDVLLTSVIMELHRRGLRRLAVITRLVEIFDNFPFPLAVLDYRRWTTLDAMIRWRRKNTKPHYYRGFREPDIDVPGPGHIIGEMCRQTGIRGEVELKTHVFLRPDEIARGRISEHQAAIQCMDRTSLNASLNKIWSAERYQEVVDQNQHRLKFVQLGSGQDPALQGVIDLRGKTTLRESAAILANCRTLVGYVGFLMHLARAAGCRSVIVFGGREHPRQSGYTCNENLFTELPCSPCWRRRTCDWDRVCMQRIESRHVTAAIDRVLARRGEPLELATEFVE